MPSLASALFTTTKTAVVHTLDRSPWIQYKKYSRGCYTIDPSPRLLQHNKYIRGSYTYAPYYERIKSKCG
jgi:hypothetical protein